MRKRIWAIVAAGAAALTLGIVAIAGGFSGVENEGGATVTGPIAEKAKSAAAQFVGGGQALVVRRESDQGNATYGVAVRKNDGSEVEVHLDRSLRALSVDRGEGDESGSGGEGEGD